MREMNLLPEEYLRGLNIRKKKKILTIIIVCIFTLMVFSYITIFWLEYSIDKNIAIVRVKIKDLEKTKTVQQLITADKNTLERRRDFLEEIQSKKIDHHGFLEELKKSIPATIILDNITILPSNNGNIKGNTNRPEDVADLMINLSKIPGVKNVILENSKNINNPQSDNEHQKIMFSIRFSY